MNFEIGTAESLSISDNEISELLWSVYVNEGYTVTERAEKIFEPSAVRSRGKMIGARSRFDHSFAGMIILVPPTSPAKMFAKENEAEIHLLAVKPLFRNHGLGKLLVNEAIKEALSIGYEKIILWTQPAMPVARSHRLFLQVILRFIRNWRDRAPINL